MISISLGVRADSFGDAGESNSNPVGGVLSLKPTSVRHEELRNT